ncbi:MAG TPA: hypothetical protein VJ351_05220 [Streptosporangiaceae bacterium]|nr:hypothetical protein [Streptosporangiaceae bacterium]
MPRSGTPEKSAAPSRPVRERPPGAPAVMRRRLLATVAAAAVVVLLFVAYVQVSRTYAVNSDSANILLMSWDMLHGNLLLHGWYLSDVSFYPTELPQYAMLEGLLGLHADTAHIAAAMTYTLAVIFAVLLARGPRDRAPGRTAWPRMALTGGLMIAPQLGVGAFVLLLSVGHIGTAVPLMLIWLVIDWAATRPRWFIPVIVGLLLTWVLVADPLVLVVGIVPLVVVCGIRVLRAVLSARPPERGAALQASWYEVSLAAAAILAYGLADLVNRLLSASGGFILHPLGYQLAPVHTWPKHAWVTGEGLLALFGAKPQGPAVELAFALLHLAGVALVAWAICRVVRRFVSWPDLVSQVLLLAIVLNVLIYIPSTLADATDLNAREFAVVLPFGAVLAGRVLAEPLTTLVRGGEAGVPGWLRGRRWRAGLASALAVGYLASLGYAAAQPSVPPANAQLATFLAEHHLTNGISGYWMSSIVTVGSDGAVTIRAVQSSLRPYLWETKGSWYDPASQRATFLVTENGTDYFSHWKPSASALAALGPPARTYHVGPYTVLVWDKNLLTFPAP